MKFTFSLEPVLKVRRHQETLQKQRLAEKVQKRDRIDELRIDVRRKLGELLSSGAAPEAARVHSIQRRAGHMMDVHRQIEKLDRDLEQVNEVIDREREKLTEVHKSRHLLEKLRECKLDDYRRELSKAEQNGLDEVAMQMENR